MRSAKNWVGTCSSHTGLAYGKLRVLRVTDGLQALE